MSSDVHDLTLSRGHAKPLYSGHPWVFADALDRGRSLTPDDGDEVRVRDEAGVVLGRGYYSAKSAIAVRLLTRNDEDLDAAFLKARIESAAAYRARIGRGLNPDDACRVVNAEGDGLPGLVVDRYGAYMSVQIATSGMERRRAVLLDALQERFTPKGIADRSDERARKAEGLAPASSLVARGTLPEEPVEIVHAGVRLGVDLRRGQKTGTYLDQFETHERFAYFARGAGSVLDVFSHTGGFALAAAGAGAKGLVLLDKSEPALRQAEANLKRNGVEDADLVCASWAEGLKHLREENRRFSVMAVDPPKFARGKDALREALNGYRDLNAAAAPLLDRGGILFTCSCSGNVSPQDFERAVAAGIAHAGRRARLIETRGAAADHPIPPGFAQGRYLKCLVLEVG